MHIHIYMECIILKVFHWAHKSLYYKTGVPNPRAMDWYRSWPVRNRAAQQEVSGGRASEASSVFTAAPHRLHYLLSPASCQISVCVVFSQERELYRELRMQGI